MKESNKTGSTQNRSKPQLSSAGSNSSDGSDMSFQENAQVDTRDLSRCVPRLVLSGLGLVAILGGMVWLSSLAGHPIIFFFGLVCLCLEGCLFYSFWKTRHLFWPSKIEKRGCKYSQDDSKNQF